MISTISGRLAQITDDFALVENNGLFYEILLPSALAERLKTEERIGQPIVLKTIYYIEAGDRKSNHFPKLVGFVEAVDREFFLLYTQVSGMGIKKALKSLVVPIRDIATAIETKSAASLSRLPGIGNRLAEKIIAELNGKVTKFALAKGDQPLAKKDEKGRRDPIEQDAIDVLVQLQYRQSEAEELVARAMEEHPGTSKVEDLISAIFRQVQQKRSTTEV